MKKLFCLSPKVFGSLLLLLSTVTWAQNKVVAYVPNWIDLNSFSNSIQYSKLTHINIAFENLYNDNGDLTFNTADNVLITKAHANNIKICVSIGGGSASGDQVLTNRYFTQISSAKRAAFVDKISNYILAHNFDGIDVDLEGPSINGDYGAFIQALSAKLKPQGKLVTAALSQGYGGDKVPSSVFQYMDFVNIMAYDGAGYWDPNAPGQHSSLDFAKSNTQYWINRGLPKSKAVLGVPFYGYGFGAAFRNRDYPYNEVIASYPGAENVDQVGSTIWYNGIPTIKAKTNYAFDQAIGGIMIWSLDYDGTGTKSLLTAINDVFKARTNVTQGPYNNVRINLPGKLELENYDVGGQDVAYNDLSSGNSGNVFRSDGVDIETTTDAGGGYNLGWIETGEWLEYSVAVASTSLYTFEIRSASTAGAIRVEVDGIDATGSIALPNTGAYQTWATTSKPNVSLTAGNHLLRVFVVTGGINLNYMNVIAQNQAPSTSIASPLANATFTAPASISISANASDADGSVSKVEFFNGTIKLGEDASSPFSFVWSNVNAGTYSITAKATDNSGASTTSAAVSISVTNPIVQAPYSGTPISIPGKIEAEHYDLGGQGVAYNDASTTNEGTALRSDGVDLEVSTDAGAGYNVGWTADGEWLEYTVNVASTGLYHVGFRTAGTAASAIRMEIDGIDVSGTVALPNTTGWQVWATTTKSNVSLTAGQHILRLFVVTGGFNLNHITVTSNQAPSVNITAPLANAIFTSPASISITANASDVDGTVSKVEFYQGATKLGEDVTSPFAFAWTNVSAGAYTLTAKATDNSGASSTSSAISITVNNPILQIPYSGSPITLPGKLEAELYDLGGQDIAYNDVTTTNSGTVFRTDGVDIEATTDAGTGYNVGWTADGEWLEYTVNVSSAGNYDVAFRTAGTATSAVRLEMDGADVTGTITLPATAGWQTWTTTTKTNVALKAGTQVLRLYVVTGGFNLNYLTVSPVITQLPYGGTAISLPGKFEAENYDIGGQNFAFNDVTTTNDGGAFRTEGVDIETCTDVNGGYNIGYTADGEWLEYTVKVSASGTYTINFRTASTSGGALRMEVDGADVTGTVALPNTGGWQTWSNTEKKNVTLTSGQHIVRIFVVTGGFNLNHVTVSVPVTGPGYLHASGKNIVNNQGNFQIKALNLGNFMVQEGYMLNLGGGYQWNIKNKIADVVGVTNRDKFYDDYLANYITKADIDSIAKWGFNSVRLPMHYNLFTPLGQQDVYIEKGFVMVDNILSWCKANNIYLILDLHAAPGGQSSGDISDYVAGQPSLWESDANRQQTIKLWKRFATRYANEEYIGGYDLINETNWTIPGNTLLMQLMKDITAAIRQVDNNHILFIEGNSYANDYTGMTPKWDNNMAYSFHKYWNDNTDGSLGFIFAIRDGQNVPIWLGEFGENSNHWIAESVSLMNKYNIGWAIWPYKKMGSISGLSSFKEPNNWSALANYINGGSKPSATTGQAILDELIQNIKVQNCTINRGYLYALMNQPGNNNTVAFKPTSLPGRITAAYYDHGKNGFAYSDAVFQTAQFGAAGGSYTAWNTGWYLRNDGVDLQNSTSENGPIVGYTETNEWMQYTVNATSSGSYSVKARMAGNGGKISISVDGVTLLSNITLPATGGWDTYQTITLGNVNLNAGTRVIRVTVSTAGYNLSFFDFTLNASAARVVESTVVDETLVSNAPNPFSGTTQVMVDVKKAGMVSIKVYDLNGYEVGKVTEGYLESGVHYFDYNASGLKSNVYLMKFVSETGTVVRKIMIAE